MKSPKPSAATSASPTPAATAAAAPAGLARDEHDPGEREHAIPTHCNGAGRVAAREADDERHDRRGRRDRRHDAHRADRHAAVEAAEPDRARDTRRRSPEQPAPGRAAPLAAIQTTTAAEPDELRPEEDGEDVQPRAS